MKLKNLKMSIAFVLAGAGMAHADLPQGMSQTDVNTFVNAMIAAGCSVKSEEESLAVETATGFHENKLTDIVDYLMEEGGVTPLAEGEGIQLVNEACN